MKNTENIPAAHNVVSSESRLLHMTARILAAVVAVGAAVLSFDALTQLAVASGISSQLAWLWAIVVDGFILIATISVFALRKRGRKALAWPFFILGLFVVISIIGNGLHPILRADELQLSGTPALGENGSTLPFWAAAVVTAVPPIALFLAIHLLTVMVTPSKDMEKEIVRESKAAERKRTKTAVQEPVQPTVSTNPVTPASQPVTPVFPAREKTVTPVAATIATVPALASTVTPEPSYAKPHPVLAEEKRVIRVPDMPEPASDEKLSSTVEEGSTESTLVTETLSEGSPEQELIQLLLSGEKVTGQKAADILGVSLRTGQVKLKKLRENLGLA